MSAADYEKHIKIFFSPDFKVQPGSEETYHHIAALLAEKDVWNLVLKKAGMKKPKAISGKRLTMCDPEYTVILNHLLYGKRGEHESMLRELAAIMGQSKSTAERTFTKNKSNVEKTADFIKISSS